MTRRPFAVSGGVALRHKLYDIPETLGKIPSNVAFQYTGNYLVFASSLTRANDPTVTALTIPVRLA